MNSWLLVDCAFVTTAVLVGQRASHCQIIAQGKATTTPDQDILSAVKECIRQIENQSSRKLLTETGELLRSLPGENEGVDRVLITSAVGGGLQMSVAGLVRIMTAESAERAALGAGANVLDVMAIDDGHLPHERIQRMRELRPDIFLLSGGVDAGNRGDVLEFAKQIAQAGLPDVPVIYAGNASLRDAVREILSATQNFSTVENVRPVLEDEVLEPTRERIHEYFMEHVVSKAAGFEELSTWADDGILPSAGAVSQLIEILALESKQNVLSITVSDSTTEVYSVFGGRFTRTVSADLGLGRGIANVGLKAGPSNFTDLATGLKEGLMNALYNLMLSPEEHPCEEDKQALLQMAAREAVRIAVAEHRQRATGLRGIRLQRDIAQIFDQHSTGETIVKPLELNLAIVSAPVFRWSAPELTAKLLLAALPTAGITHLALDKSGLMPALGLLSFDNIPGAYQLLLTEGLEYLGTAVQPLGSGKGNTPALTVTIKSGEGPEESYDYGFNELHFLQAPAGSEIVLQPQAGLDLGKGRGRAQTLTMKASTLGLIIDTREGGRS